MDNINTVPQGNANYEITDPATDRKGCFTASLQEKICAFLSYILSYAYICILTANDRNGRFWLALTALLIITITELIHAGKERLKESWIWLGCFAATVVSGVLDREQVWDQSQVMLFIHIFAVWWILSRSGSLLEGESGHLLPLDVINGFLLIPFGHFFLRIRTVLNALSGILKKPRTGKKINLWAIAAMLVSISLFLKAGGLLIAADSGFRDRFTEFTDVISNALDILYDILDEEVWFNFLLSLPVGCWLFGLMSGSARVSKAALERDRSMAYSVLDMIRRVPSKVWASVIGAFSLMYLAFFWLQSSYLFGAFTGTLPDGFIVSEYAREGFFELCRVITVNFSLLWLVTRMSSSGSDKKTLLIPCLVLLAESMLFAVIAFSKLALYISIFGFTPLRLQSTWLVCLCFTGCVLWTYSLLTGKKTFRKWMIFGAVSLSLLCLV